MLAGSEINKKNINFYDLGVAFDCFMDILPFFGCNIHYL